MKVVARLLWSTKNDYHTHTHTHTHRFVLLYLIGHFIGIIGVLHFIFDSKWF